MDWESLSLDWPQTTQKAYYQKSLPAHLSQEGPADTLFILLSSTYSTWKRGSWVNQLVATCRKLKSNAHFLGIGGFLTSEILNAQPVFPPVTGQEVAEDFYVRIHQLLKSWEERGVRYQRIILVGASGGASLVLQLLAQDAKAHSWFTSGIAFNPILNTEHAFKNLDSSVDKIVHEQGFPEQMGLTNTSPQSIGMLLSGILTKGSFNPTPRAEETLALTAFDANLKARSEATLFKRLFFNEFVATDLHDTTTASHSTDFKWDWTADDMPADALPWNQGDRHAHFYLRYAFRRHQLEGRVPEGMGFVEYSSILPTLNAIQVPAYIVFASDDPVLSKNEFSNLPTPVETLDAVKKVTDNKPNIRLFNPPFGGHMGYFLDSNYVEGVLGETLR